MKNLFVLVALWCMISCTQAMNLRHVLESAMLNVANSFQGGKNNLPGDPVPIGEKDGKKGYGRGQRCPNDEEMGTYVSCLTSDVGGIEALVECLGCENMEPHKDCKDPIFKDVGYCAYCAVENPDVECKLCSFTSKDAYKKFCTDKKH